MGIEQRFNVPFILFHLQPHRHRHCKISDNSHIRNFSPTTER